MGKTKALFILLAAALALTCAAPALAAEGDTISVLALGQAPAGTNQAQARDQAVANAISQAVGQTAAKLADPATLRTRMAAFAAGILSNAANYVTSYDLEGSTQHQGHTLVMVTVHVNRQALLSALDTVGLRLPAGSLPPTLVLIAEEAGPGRPAAYWWGTGQAAAYPEPVARVLKSLGLKTIDPAALAPQIPAEARQQVLSEEQALALARMAGAGLVLMGRVRTYPVVSPAGENPPPVAQLLALDVSDGSTLAMVEEDGPVFRATPGPEAGAQIISAVEASVSRLLDQVSKKKPAAPAAEKSQVVIEVAGVRSLAQLYRFESVVGSLHALVESLTRESVAAGTATFQAKLRVPAATLADQLLLQDYGSFLVNVVEAQAARLKVVLIPKR